MYRIPIEAYNKLMRGERPLTYVLIHTHFGYRAIAAKELSKIFDTILVNVADGTVTAGGTSTAGSASMGIIDKSGRLLSISGLERSLQPQYTDFLTAWQRKDLQHIVIELDNIDQYYSRILPKEPFLSRDIYVYVGFEDLPFMTHHCLFKGYITSVNKNDVLIIEADEKMNGLSDTWYLPRAGRYSAPKNTNDRLPYPYGDLTDGTSGNWILPCINTAAYVYCYAAFAVMTVAEGNSINIYADGTLVSPANYTFNASNNYEGKGTIATITFSSDQGNAVISARGKGKAASGILMENVVDQIYDVLTVENSFSPSIFESTLKARARAIFTANSYKAAGVINSDINYWEMLQKMMSSFLGSAYLNGSGDLCLEIDDGLIRQTLFAGIISRSDADFEAEDELLSNLINQCPASYAYDYVNGSNFKSHTDETAHANLKSQSIFEKQTPNEPYPFYWCRDLTTVQAIQDIIVDKFNRPMTPALITDKTLKNIHVDVGDVVIYSAERLYDDDGYPLYNHLWKVLSVSPDTMNNSQTFRVLQTGYYLIEAYIADGSIKADGLTKAGGSRDLKNIY